MNKLIIFLIIFVICLVIMCDIQTNIETYDALLPDLSATKCGTLCTNATNCHAFGYKPQERKCYLSQRAILGKPIDGVFAEEYSILDRRCNKIDYLTIDTNRYINDDTLMKNSIYMCSDGAHNWSDKFQFANNGASSLNGPGQMELKPSPVTYNVVEITWPKTKTDEIRENVIYVDKHQPKKPAKKEEKIEPKYGYIESTKEYSGHYMFPHQCTTGVHISDCLKFCNSYEDCEGVEWNSDFGKICCPKTRITNATNRQHKYKNGRFYLKRGIDTLKNDDKIIITK